MFVSALSAAHAAPGGVPNHPAAPTLAGPAGQQVASDKVQVQVMVVYATSAHDRVDSKLANLARYLNNLRYSGYELLQTQSLSVAKDGSETFNVEGGRKVPVTLLDRDDAKARMRVQISGSNGKLLDTTLSVNRNGTFIVAGPKHKDGILVLPLTARY